MKLDFDLLKDTYFTFDLPVPYQLADGNILEIFPVLLKDSRVFLSSADIISIDKNSLPDAKIIQMSYLEFLANLAYGNEVVIQKMVNIFLLCLKIKQPIILIDENKRFLIEDKESGKKIKAKEFEDIRRIILYQNFPNYDDEYINPDLKKNMEEYDQLKSKTMDYPNLERQIAIISSHTGITKQQQLEMTYRSHSILFSEVCGEVDFETTRSVALYAGVKDFDHWIFRKKKNKFDGYLVSKDKFTNENMGGQKGVRTAKGTELGDSYDKMFNNFNK